MEFFGVGPGELLVVLVIALIVFGPRRLPEIGRTLGKTIREFREASQELTTQLRSEMDAASEELKSASEELSGHHRIRDATPAGDKVSEQAELDPSADGFNGQAPGADAAREGQTGPDATDQELY